MIKHVVCFKLKDNRPQSCEEAKNILMSMKGKVPQIIDIHAGIDFLRSERSFDLILEVIVEDKSALEDYQHDTYHCNTVKPYMHNARLNSVAVDYVLE